MPNGIGLPPQDNNPATGSIHEGYMVYNTTQSLYTGVLPKVGNQEIITDSRLQVPTNNNGKTGNFLVWTGGPVDPSGNILGGKWQQSQDGQIFGENGVAGMTINGTLQFIGTDQVTLCTSGNEAFQPSLQVEPNDINFNLPIDEDGIRSQVKINQVKGQPLQVIGQTTNDYLGWLTVTDLIPSLQKNCHYVNAESTISTLDQALQDVGTQQSQAIFFTPGTFSGSYELNNKNLLALIGPAVADTKTMCQLEQFTVNNTSQRIRISNIQFTGVLTLNSFGNNYYSGINKTNMGTSIDGTGNHYFSDCEFSGIISVQSTFSGIITFNNCNFTGSNIFLYQSSPSQVYFSNCLGFGTRPTNATYLSFNANANLTSTQNATDIQTSYITLPTGKGTAGQVLTSQGDNQPLIWSAGGGGGGGISEVTATAPLSVTDGTTAPNISLNTSAITSTLIKEIESLDNSISVAYLPNPTGKTAQVSIADIGTQALYQNIQSLQTNSKGQVIYATNYPSGQPVISVSGGQGISIIGDQYPQISNSGILNINTNQGISSTGGQNPILSNTGILSMNVGQGLSSTGGQNPTIENTGVRQIFGGPGIITDNTTGVVSLTNTGVTNIANIGTGLYLSQQSGNVQIQNTGVTELVAGSNISLSANTGSVIISASGGGGGGSGNVYQNNANGGSVAIDSLTPSNGSIFLGNNGANIKTVQNNNIVMGQNMMNYIAPPQGNCTRNVAIGCYSAQNVDPTTQFEDAVLLGTNAFDNPVPGNYNLGAVAIGKMACAYGGGHQSVCIGQEAGIAQNGARCVTIGTYCNRGGYGYGNISIGDSAFDDGAGGETNICIGVQAGVHLRGDRNIIIGTGVGQGTYGPNFWNTSNITAIGYQYNNPSSNGTDSLYMDNGNAICGIWNTNPQPITAGTPVVDITGDLKVSNLSQTGDIELTNASTVDIAGSLFLRVKINGTVYRIPLLPDV